ncbi:MAG: hypothetical protein CL561_12980 [Alphaproteobacteria bacterium]|nr:hypothetical protein [Alphaproteobacteria bacterium]
MSTCTKKVAAFIRTYNDLDHMSPYLHAMCKDENISLSIFIINLDKSFLDDFRIKYLENNGAQVKHFYDVLGVNSTYYKLIWSLAASNNQYLKLISKFISRPIKTKIMGTTGHIKPWAAAKFFENKNHHEFDLIAYDVAGKFYDTIFKEAQKYHTKCVAVPHSSDNFDNILISNSMVNGGALQHKEESLKADKVILTSAISKEIYIRRGLITVPQGEALGCPRFTKDWIETLLDIIPRTPLPEYDGFKIVLFPPKPNRNAFNEEISRIIQLISNIPNVKLGIKVETRTGAFSVPLPKNVIRFPDQVTSSQLIEWADLSLFTATSVIMESVCLDKPALYLEKTMSNRLVIEDYIKNWAIPSRDALYQRIVELRDGKSARTYTVDEREAALNALVYNNQKDEEVVQAYTSALYDLMS